MIRAASIPDRYRSPFFQGIERPFLNSLRASAIAGAVFLVVVYVSPLRQQEIQNVEDVPERFARLILEEPAPAPVSLTPSAPDSPAPKVEEPTPPKPVVKPTPKPRRTPRNVPKSTGQAGRERAQKQVTQQLAAVEKTLDSAISQLANNLPSSSEAAPKRPRRGRSRSVRKARTGGEVSSIGSAVGGAAADLNSSSVGSDLIAIDQIEDVVVAGELGGTGAGGAGGSGTGELRSNSSLLSVVRRYAAGIQFCYDEVLKSSPDLKGKMVVSITVAANGGVTQVTVVEDGLRSASVRECVVSQIKGWKFGSIPQGSVTFKTPFVFTPPK